MSAFLWSLSGLFMRAIETDLMTIIFLRGVVSGTTVFLLFAALERRDTWAVLKAMRWPTLAAAVLSAASMISGLGSLYYTSIADSMVIYATAPFITAFLAFFFIGEKSSRTTIIASSIAFAGVLWSGALHLRRQAHSRRRCRLADGARNTVHPALGVDIHERSAVAGDQIGGAIVLAALFAHILLEMRRNRTSVYAPL